MVIQPPGRNESMTWISMFDAWKTWQSLGPLPKVKLLVGHIQDPTKLKGAKGIRLIE